jgi:hypothetical protein
MTAARGLAAYDGSSASILRRGPAAPSDTVVVFSIMEGAGMADFEAILADPTAA